MLQGALRTAVQRWKPTSVILQHTPLGGSRCSVVHHRRLHALVVGCASNDNTKNRRPFSSAAGAGVIALSSLSAGQIFAKTYHMIL